MAPGQSAEVSVDQDLSQSCGHSSRPCMKVKVALRFSSSLAAHLQPWKLLSVQAFTPALGLLGSPEPLQPEKTHSISPLSTQELTSAGPSSTRPSLRKVKSMGWVRAGEMMTGLPDCSWKLRKIPWTLCRAKVQGPIS